MRRTGVKPLVLIDTTAEAAEQALPNCEGPRRRPGLTSDLPLASWWLVSAGAGLPRTSYPCRCDGTSHPKLHA